MTIDELLELIETDAIPLGWGKREAKQLAAEVRRQANELKEYKAMLYQAAIDFDKERAEVRRLREELALAVAHDRQPYPTVDAYGKVCDALNKSRERERVLVDALEYLVKALEEVGLNKRCWTGRARAALEAVKE